MADAAASAHADLAAAAAADRLVVGALERPPPHAGGGDDDGAPRCLVTLLAADPPRDAFDRDLAAWAARHAGAPVGVEVEVSFPPGFPLAPPRLRLLRPILVSGTGGVACGAFLAPPLLPDGWTPSCGSRAVVRAVRQCLADGGARVDLHTAAVYPRAAYEAAARRLARRRDPALHHPQPFRGIFTVYGGAFAESVMGLRLPPGFDAGNRVLLPGAALEKLARGELSELATGGGGSGGGGGGGGSGGGGGGGSADAPDGFAAESAMIFELVSALRFPTYVGVREFTVPHADVVVLPAGVLAAMGVPEGSQVGLARVVLPPARGLTLQPHDAAFGAATAGGAAAREYLEASLTRYACVAPGEVIECDGGGEGGGGEAGDGAGGGGGGGDWGGGGARGDDLAALPPDVLSALLDAGEDVRAFLPQGGGGTGGSGARAPPTRHRFNVVAVEPASAPAVALWSLFSAQVPITLLPAVDAHVLKPPVAGRPRDAAAAAAAGTGALSVTASAAAAADLATAAALGAGSAGAAPAAVGAPEAAPLTAAERDDRRRRAAAAAAGRAAAAAAAEAPAAPGQPGPV